MLVSVTEGERKMSSIRCPACGTVNPAGSQYCSSCARRLDESTGAAVERQRAAAVATQTTAIRWVSILVVTSTVTALIVIVAVLVLVVHM